MTCPKCENGIIENVIFKVDGEKGKLCDYCGTVWFEGELIAVSTGHEIAGFRTYDKEYTLEKDTENDADSQYVKYPKYV
jgi:hypothetical protein